MCFGGGGGGGGAAPVVNVAQPVSKQFDISEPKKLDPQYRSLIAEGSRPQIRGATERKRRAQAGMPQRQALTTGMTTGMNVAMGDSTFPSGGVNL